jgi:hypothetical protein
VKNGTSIESQINIKVLVREKKDSKGRSYSPKKYIMRTVVGDGDDDFEYEKEFTTSPVDMDHDELQNLVYADMHKEIISMKHLIQGFLYAHFYNDPEKLIMHAKSLILLKN